MSKQKKRKKKQQKERLPAKEHYKFDILLAIIIIYNIFLLTAIYKNWFSFLKPDSLYFNNDLNIFLILLIIFNFSILVIYGNLHTFATNNKYPFKDYFRGTNKKAKEKAEKCFLKCGILFLVSIICFIFGLQINTETTENKMIKNNLLSEKILFNFNEIEKIKIYLSYEKTSLKGLNSSYLPVLEITANDNIYDLEFKGFSYDYLKLEKFLNYFPKNIISIDKTNIEDVLISDTEQQEAFNRIFS